MQAAGLAAIDKLTLGLTEFQALIDAKDKQVCRHCMKLRVDGIHVTLSMGLGL